MNENVSSTFVDAQGRAYVNGQPATSDQYVASIAASLYADAPDEMPQELRDRLPA